jgi:hypothetical protein
MTKHGAAYVLESDTFQMYMPKYFLKIAIPEVMERRHFTVTGFEKYGNGKKSPKLTFSMK